MPTIALLLCSLALFQGARAELGLPGALTALETPEGTGFRCEVDLNSVISTA